MRMIAPVTGWLMSPVGLVRHMAAAALVGYDGREAMTAGLCLTSRSGEDRGREFVGLAQRGQVPAGDDDGFDTESCAGQFLLELDREEAVFTASDDCHCGRPGGECAGVAHGPL
jgi:hypothetical protein